MTDSKALRWFMIPFWGLTILCGWFMFGVKSGNGYNPQPITIGTLSANNSITSETAFQPRSSGPCQILISTVLSSGTVGLRGTSVVSMCSTQNGTYTDVGAGSAFAVTTLNVADSKDGPAIPIPTGWWVKVTNTAVGVGATLTSTYTRWDYN